MKRNFIIAVSALLVLASSCQKTAVNNIKGNGYLSFSEFSLGLDEEVITKAEEADGSAYVFIYDQDENEVLRRSYSEIKSGNKISLPAGNYRLVARTTEAEVPTAAFKKPVYGVTHDFQIAAGLETKIGELTCTLLQCEVTISYSDEFLAAVTGAGATYVEVTQGQGLEYKLNADKTYDQSSGYFAVNGNTMTVRFKGSIDGKTATMPAKTFTGVAPRQKYQIKFVTKTIVQGNVIFDIEIENLISDATLNEGLTAEEVILGPDPNAPKDDGGIRFLLADDCDATITADETDIVLDADGKQINSKGLITIPLSSELDYTDPKNPQPTMAIKFNAEIPKGLAELNVTIESDNNTFLASVGEATNGTMAIDLVNPTCSEIIFNVVPFPHGADQIYGKNSIAFDLSRAQYAIVSGGFNGTHLFTMTVVDLDGKEKVYEITMILE